jgi:rubrerythrin
MKAGPGQLDMQMTKTQNLEQAKNVLSWTVVERYDAMGWFDEAGEGEAAEAKEMEDALKEGDEISVGVALDRALERYDLMGAYTCSNCGKDFDNPNNECTCDDPTKGLYDEAEEVRVALEKLRS